MAAAGVLAGVALDELSGDLGSSLENPSHVLLVAVTEKRTREQLDRYVDVLKKVVA
jgi:hypothetical protein